MGVIYKDSNGVAIIGMDEEGWTVLLPPLYVLQHKSLDPDKANNMLFLLKKKYKLTYDEMERTKFFLQQNNRAMRDERIHTVLVLPDSSKYFYASLFNSNILEKMGVIRLGSAVQCYIDPDDCIVPSAATENYIRADVHYKDTIYRIVYLYSIQVSILF